ncbi:MAG: hypothetical protein JNK42_00505 [Caedimonas sp.]|nr:hypothetical protein [Caedimonas sp.]
MHPKHDEFNLQEELKNIRHLLDLFTANVDEDLQYKKYLIYDAKESLNNLLERINVSES